MSLVTRINELAKEKKLSISAIESELGFGKSTIRNWDKSAPAWHKVLAVADLLDVDLLYLLTGKLHSSNLSPEHEEILTIFDKLNPKQQTILKAKLYELEADIKEDE